MKTQKKSKYNFFSNIKYCYSILFKHRKNYRFLLPFSLILGLLASIISTYIPSLIVYFIENGFDLYKALIILLSIFIIFLIFKIIASYIDQILNMGYTIVRATYPFFDLTKRTLEMDYQKFEDKDVKDKFMRAQLAVDSNYDGVEGIFHDFPKFLTATISFFIFAIPSLFISPLILLVVIIGFILNLLLAHFLKKKDRKLNDEWSKMDNKIRYISNISENEVSSKDIRNYSLSKKFTNLLNSYSKELKKLILKVKFLWFIPDGELSLFAFFRDLLAYAILIYDAVNGNINASEFVTLIASLTAFNSYIDQIIMLLDVHFSYSLRVRYYREFYDIKGDFNHQNKEDLSLLSSPFEIEIKNLSFKYKGSEKYIFKDFSLKINKYQKIALVGINGAGKTTLAKLLVGLYMPTEGEILINKHNLKDFNIEDYYNYVSIINQDVFPLAFTIKNNIVCSYPYDEERFKKCIKNAGLDEKINSLKDKENTFLTQNFDKNGINLSGGEIQKMLLARALYKKSSFLILDEPTAALDPLAEKNLYEKYNELTKNQTSIFISHRLSSTRFCDEIYYIEDGKIIEKGNHDELMALKGKYFEIFNIQAKYYKDKKEGDESYEHIF